MAGKMTMKQGLMALLVALALGLVVWVPPGLTAGQAQVLGAVMVTLGLWGTGLVPNYLASLIFFSVVLVAGIAPPERVFAGFSSAAVWLIVSGFVIGSAISVSGLGARLAGALGPLLGGSYLALVGGLTVVAMLLGFVMPSSVGRAVVLMPIGMALAARAGFGPGSNGRVGVAVALSIACNMPSFAILTANIPNMVLAGSAETIQGVHLGYAAYLALHYPVLGVVKSALTVGLVLWLYPARAAHPEAEPQAAAAQDRGAQARVAGILLVTLGFWVTDSLHGINPAWIGLAAATLLLLPGVGVVPPAGFKAGVDFGLLLFVTGALALGALVNSSGLGAVIGRGLEALLPLAPGRDAINFLSLSLLSVATSLFTTAPGLPTVLTPLGAELARATGFDLPAVLMTQVVGFSTVLLPYQVAPLVVAMQLSGEGLGRLTRVVLVLAAVTVIVLLPLDYLWWRLLGWI